MGPRYRWAKLSHFGVARSPFCGIAAPQPNRFRGAGTNSGIILASLVTQVAVGDVNSVQRAYPGLGDCWGLEWVGESLYIEAVPLALRPFLRLTPEVLLTTMSGHHMGSVDNWLCQNIHQIFGGSPAGYPRLRVESVWASSS